MPVHVTRLGSQIDIAGIIAPSEDADRTICYLTKYLTKSIADTYQPEEGDDWEPDPGREAHPGEPGSRRPPRPRLPRVVGKTFSEHRADRATVVRQALAEAGMQSPEIERMAATCSRPTAGPGSCRPTPSRT